MIEMRLRRHGDRVDGFVMDKLMNISEMEL
jgi:hypothetical protein